MRKKRPRIEDYTNVSFEVYISNCYRDVRFMSNFSEIRKNTILSSVYADALFTGAFELIPDEIKLNLNEKRYQVGDERLSSRVLNHWYVTGLIADDRPNGRGWKKFSLSELVWIKIVLTLRGFGLDLKRIRLVRDQFERFNEMDPISEIALLDFFILAAINSSEPIKVIVFESGQAEILGQSDLDIAYELDGIQEDFISIDLGLLLNKLITKKDIKADYLNYNKLPKDPIVEEVEESLKAEDIQSITIRVKNRDYLVDEEFFLKSRSKANALMKMLRFGKLVENKNDGKSTFLVTNKKKVKRDAP